MGEQALSSPKKKILYIGLFIVPFFLAMALIFMGKNLGTLPIMNEQGKFVELKIKNPEQYYTIPEFSLKGFWEDSVQFKHQDSTLYLITLFPESNIKEWQKHLMYIGGKIIPRATNVRVISVYENDFELSNWKENPKEYVKKQSKNWHLAHATHKQFGKLLEDLRLEINDSTGLPDYVIVDKEEHIRAYCTINDAKIARDIPKMFKLLNNQYVPRKLDISNSKD